MNITLPFNLIHHDNDAGEILAQHILDNHFDQHSRAFNKITIWCSSRSQIHPLQQTLILQAQKRDIHSITLPEIITLYDWAWQQDHTSSSIISETEKNLILVEALRENRNFFNTHNIWSMANELVKLFNECTLAQVPLESGREALEHALNASYRFDPKNESNSVSSDQLSMHHISRESEILYHLWLAYREQIQARGSCDPLEHYVNVLSQLPTAVENIYYVIHQHRFHTCELKFLHHIQQHNTLQIIYPNILTSTLTCQNHPHTDLLKPLDRPDTIHSPLDIVFDASKNLPERVSELTRHFPKNLLFEKLSLFTCRDKEVHVRAVCLQVKCWLFEGKSNIGIVANDRLLIRRIRAVLEEDGIFPKDLGGWSFSTTSAATCIEILLDAIDGNFSKTSLLTLLGSPFLSRDEDYLNEYYTFKHFLSTRNNLSSDTLGTFRQLAKECFNIQSNDDLTNKNSLIICLENLAHASQELQTLRLKGEQYLQKFNTSLLGLVKDLGIKKQLSNDAAGIQLLEILTQSNNFIQASTLRITWIEWRQWLKHLFEKNYFIPEISNENVTVCGFEYIDNIKFDHVVLAGVEEKRLQNLRTQKTFFNEKVRYELKLPTSSEDNAINFIRFRQLVESSQSLMMSAETEENGEQQNLSPWVDMIEYFNQHCYQVSIANSTLEKLLNQQELSKQKSYCKPSKPPCVSDNTHLLSERFSSTKYQSLLDCPYQFFAKYILDLRAQTISDDLQASDYGQLIHTCLKEFHFGKTIHDFSKHTNEQLCAALEMISNEQFKNTTFTSTSVQGWLQKWLATIPHYITWCLQRHQEWRILRGEVWCEHVMQNNILLQGQIDRIDQNNNHLSVIDYKTGSVIASDTSVTSGETVQLPFYALLTPNVSQVEYLSLGERNTIKSKVIINGDKLEQLKQQHISRISQLYREIQAENSLPANGDDTTCGFCEYQGMCRKSHWQN